MAKESIGRTLGVAVAVCVVCSVLVSTLAVVLKPIIERNKIVDKYRNILIAAGVEGAEDLDAEGVDDEFKKSIDPIIIDLAKGQPAKDPPATLDERKAAKDPVLGEPIKPPSKKSDPGVKRRSKLQTVYWTSGEEARLILPVHGKGLWSTMYGFVALDASDKASDEDYLNKIVSFAFYEHGETPGLGGEVDNKTWKASWQNRLVYGETYGKPEIDVVKGVAPKADVEPHQINGLSGATLTANGVERLVLFWLGEEGYGKYLKNLKQQRTGGENE